MEISVAVAGQLATATFAAWAVSVVSVGPLSDSFGRRPVCLAGLFVLSASVLGSAFAPNIEALLVLRVLTGLAGGMLPPNAVGAVSDIISPARRAQAIGALLAISVLTSAVTVPMVALLAEWNGWRFGPIRFGRVPGISVSCQLALVPTRKQDACPQLGVSSRDTGRCYRCGSSVWPLAST